LVNFAADDMDAIIARLTAYGVPILKRDDDDAVIAPPSAGLSGYRSRPHQVQALAVEKEQGDGLCAGVAGV
jgi:hypothetical protein